MAILSIGNDQCIQFPVVSLAVMKIGAVITTANPLNTPGELAKQMADSSPALVFTTRDLVRKLPREGKFLVILLEENRIKGDDDSRVLCTAR